MSVGAPSLSLSANNYVKAKSGHIAGVTGLPFSLLPKQEAK